jgi:BirA family biotin operon repressor/biotin-[acetyl-CoA-carboxylase] ligase
MLDRLRRDAALAAIEDLGFFNSVRWLEEIDSTNRSLARELKSDASIPLPALLVADRQHAGIGRGKNAWWSPTGCLMFSIAVPWPNVHPDLAKLPLRVGLAVAQALAPKSVSQPKVKWPNDVYIDDRKVAGILIESSSHRCHGQLQDVSIIGIGINCCVDLGSAPDEIRSTAISLHEVARFKDSGSTVPESTTPESVLLSVLLQWLEAEQQAIAEPQSLMEVWPEWSWLDGKWVEVTTGGSVLVGLAKGIDAQGALIVEDRFGRSHTILSATVRTLNYT